MSEEDESQDDVLNTQETFVNEDFDEGGTPVAEGEHIVIIDAVKGENHDFKDYTGPRAAVVMVVDDESDDDNDRKIFDWINLPAEEEKGGNRKRRAAILSKLGLIERGESGDVKFNWKDLEGTRCIVEVEHSTSEKNGKTRTFANVTFAGYRSLDSGDPESREGAAAAAGDTKDASAETDGKGDDFSDI